MTKIELAIGAAGVALLVLCGCSTTGGQPAKSQTLTLTHNNINIYLPASTNEAQVASIEIGTQAQAVESSGTESYAPSASPSNTTSPSATFTPTSTGSGVASLVGGAVTGLIDGLSNSGSSSSSSSADCADGSCTPSSDCTDGSCTP